MVHRAISGLSGPVIWARQPSTVLAAFLFLVLATGGSSWAHEGQLIVLRPVAVLVAAWGIATMQSRHWRENKLVWGIFWASLLLTAAHLIPLPYSWWASLPGREIIINIDKAVGFGEMARPLSMHPEATYNALFSLAVPLAVLSLGVQLDDAGHRRMAGLLVILIAVSAFVGLLQLSGSSISFYERVSDIRPSGLFNNRNHQGALLAMGFPLAVLAWKRGFASGASPKVERGVATALAVLILPLVVVTGSRSGLILSCVALLLVLFELPWKVGGSRASGWLAAKFAALFAAFGLLVWLTVVTGRSTALTRLAGSNEDLRYPLWQSILDALPTYWPWGVGIGGYASAYQIHEPDALLRPAFSNHAHNELLEIAFTAGIPGLLILTAASIAVLLGAIRAWKMGSEAGALPRAGLVLVLILALASSSDYPVRTPIMMAILAIAALWMVQRPSAPSPPNKMV
jgi:hypothetical protein